MTTHEFHTPGPVDLFVELGKGSVTVDAVPQSDTTTVEVHGQDSDLVEVRQDGAQILVIAPRQRTGFFGGEQAFDVTVSLPEESNAVAKTGSADLTFTGHFGLGKLKTGSGDCQLDTFSGPLLVETGSGDLEIALAGGELRVKSGSGDVDVSHTASSVSVSTGSGDVQIGMTQGPTVVKTGSGDLLVAHAGGDLSMSTGSGDLRVDHATRGRFTAKGASGDVRIGVEAGVPVWTDVTTVSGQIRSNLQGAGQPEPGADYIELRAKTVSGDIELVEV